MGTFLESVFKPKYSIGWVFGLALLLIFGRNIAFFQYLSLHPTLTLSSMASALLLWTQHILLGALFLLSWWGFGLRFFSLWKVDGVSSDEKPLWAIPLGAGLSAYVLFALGLAGFLYPAAGWVLLLTGLILGGRSLVENLIRYWAKAAGILRKHISPFGILMGGAVLFALWHGWVNALSPPTEWDTLVYHLTVPRLWVESHKIGTLDSPYLAQIPLHAEMLYLWAMLVGPDTLAQLLHWLMAGFCGLWVRHLGRRYFSERAGNISAAIFVTTPLYTRLSGAAMNDFTLALFSLLFVAAFARWLDENPAPRIRSLEGRGEKKDFWLFFSGLWLGLACVCKYTGPYIGIAVGFLWGAFGGGRFQYRLKNLVKLAALTLLFCAPWYLRTYLLTGNPIYPYFYEIFGGRDWSVDLAKSDRLSVGQMGVPKNLLNVLVLPWHLAAHAVRFSLLTNDEPWTAVFFGVFLGVMALAVLIKFWERPPPLLVPILALSWVYAAVWFYVYQNIRFLLTAIALLSLALGVLIEVCLSRKILLLSWTVLAGLGLCVAVPTRQNQFNQILAAAQVPSQTHPEIPPRDRYLELVINHYPIFSWMNKNLSPSDRILFLREVRGYYLRRPFLFGDAQVQGLIDYVSIKDAAALRARLLQLGITHILFNANIFPVSSSNPDLVRHHLQLTKELMDRYGVLVKQANDFYLFKLKNPPPF